MKTCVKCGTEQSVDRFPQKSRNRDGLDSQCKTCKRAYDNAHYRANPERRDYIRANSDRRVAEVRAWLRSFLGSHPCVDCGEADILVLEFDHQRDKVDNISRLSKVGNLQTVMDEVAKCVVRCANCHRRKTARDFGSWRIEENVPV